MRSPPPAPPPPPRRDASARRQCAAEGSCCERRWRVYGSQFGNENRGKKSVELDIKDPEQLAVLRAMIADSDIFLTNVRPAFSDDVRRACSTGGGGGGSVSSSLAESVV